MTDPVIETENLSREYNIGNQTVHALTDLSIRIDHGDFVAIMGPSGSGKSTCMQLLGCLQSPTSGRYRLDGLDLSEMESDALAGVRNRMIGFVFQSFNLLPRASALTNVELPLVYGRVGRRERRERAREALRAVGLEDRMDHRPTQLSGGQMQRVAIARALVNSPRLMLADEPTGALDTRTGVEIMELFTQLNEGGMTVVIVTHEEEVARFARRQMRFRDGRLISDQATSPVKEPINGSAKEHVA
jgi:putative ABC transport system ATP-binding protein